MKDYLEHNAKDIRDLTIYTKTIPAHPASFTDFPSALHPDIRTYLTSHNIPRLYTQQAEMFEKAQSGENVVITTSTASGKTLSFLLPVLQAVLDNPLTRAIFVYPTKALAADQYRALQPKDVPISAKSSAMEISRSSTKRAVSRQRISPKSRSYPTASRIIIPVGAEMKSVRLFTTAAAPFWVIQP